jgi:membrane protease YdiL (CAAX protease family)
VAPGAASLLSVAASTALFALGHRAPEMPAAVAYGLLMAGLWVVRRDLLSCVAAHATTNVALALYVRETGSWGVW